MENIGHSINKIVFEAILSNKGFILATLISKWNEILPLNLSINSTPVGTKPISSSTFHQLIIGVRNNSVGTELSFQTQDLIGKVNQLFSYDVIKTIKILNREDLWGIEE